MMYPTDAAKLAFTKLRARRIRLIVLSITASLLFAVLITATLLGRGFFSNIEQLSKDGLASRFIVAATPVFSDNNAAENPGVIKRAEEIHKELLARKTTAANTLMVDYDPTVEERPVLDLPNGNKFLNVGSVAGARAYIEYLRTLPAVSLENYKQYTQPYGATSYYSEKSLAYRTDKPSLEVLKDGRESLDTLNGSTSSATESQAINDFQNNWKLIDKRLLETFKFKGQTFNRGDDKSIPVVVPYEAAQAILNLDPLPIDASSQEKKSRLESVRSLAAGYTYEVCYRNATSVKEVVAAAAQQQEIKDNTNNKDYVASEPVYAPGNEPCVHPVVQSDERPEAEIDYANRLQEFDRQFGAAPPESKIIKFRVVGITPSAASTVGAYDFSSLMQMFSASSLGNGWFSPLELENEDQLISKLFQFQNGFTAPPTFYAEFNSAEAAKKVIANGSCSPDSRAEQDIFQKCIQDGKNYQLFAFGSNSLALNDAKHYFQNVLLISGLGVAIVASLIMVGLVGRIITDARRETAVFRAVGATRFDILQIYTTYAGFVILLISLIAIGLGYAGALIVERLYGPDFNVTAAVLFGSDNLDQTFSLLKFNLADIIYILLAVLFAGILSVIIPLAMNVRRSPIKDMREE